MPVTESTPIASLQRSASRRSRSALGPWAMTGYPMNRSSTPSSAKTSASPIVATVNPTAPAASWRRAKARLLWVLACGRNATPRSRISPAIAIDPRVDPIEVDDDGRRVERGGRLVVEESAHHRQHLGSRTGRLGGVPVRGKIPLDARVARGTARWDAASSGPEPPEGVGEP